MLSTIDKIETLTTAACIGTVMKLHTSKTTQMLTTDSFYGPFSRTTQVRQSRWAKVCIDTVTSFITTNLSASYFFFISHNLYHYTCPNANFSPHTQLVRGTRCYRTTENVSFPETSTTSKQHSKSNLFHPQMFLDVHHRLCGSASTVLTATGQVNGRWRILTPHRIETHEPTATKFRTIDYVRGRTA